MTRGARMMEFPSTSPWLRAAAAGMLFSAGIAEGQGPRQTDADHYTRYELLAPGSAKFRILYDVTATTAGATTYFNVIRRGSVASDERVSDRMTGKPLAFAVVNGRVAAAGGVRGADSTTEYIAINLARPVPRDGEVRLLIDKTYEDARSYLAGADTLVFTRSLGIRKNSVVLPVGYEVINVNYPSQVRSEPDGRVALSFMNVGPSEVPYVVRARRLGVGGRDGGERSAGDGGAHMDREQRPAPPGSGLRGGPPTGEGSIGSRIERNQSLADRSSSLPMDSPQSRDVLRDPRLAERARQDREIVYFLQQPQTNAFDLYHDYTESRPGVDRYLNVVRAGSQASNPSAYVLDTGERLTTRTLKGAQITDARIDIGQDVTPATEVVVISFTAPRAGESVRLRISETYTDPARYRQEGDMLVWDRAFGRPANAMVLPAGWYLTNCSVPATVSLAEDGRVRLDFTNPRNDEIAVLLTAKRR
ncbi:MAG: hypothetical protein ACT4P7_05895 [Gemmatimonadaceae bacterium]